MTAGEGWCRYCGRIEPLSDEGRLIPHRGFSGAPDSRDNCRGSLQVPTEPPGPDVDPDSLEQPVLTITEPDPNEIGFNYD